MAVGRFIVTYSSLPRGDGRSSPLSCHPPFGVLRSSSLWRKRPDSVPVSMTWALWMRRTRTALERRAPVKTLVHSPKPRLLETKGDPGSSRSEIPWKTSSARPSGNARYPARRGPPTWSTRCRRPHCPAPPGLGFVQLGGESGEGDEAHPAALPAKQGPRGPAPERRMTTNRSEAT